MIYMTRADRTGRDVDTRRFASRAVRRDVGNRRRRWRRDTDAAWARGRGRPTCAFGPRVDVAGHGQKRVQKGHEIADRGRAALLVRGSHGNQATRTGVGVAAVAAGRGGEISVQRGHEVTDRGPAVWPVNGPHRPV